MEGHLGICLAPAGLLSVDAIRLNSTIVDLQVVDHNLLNRICRVTGLKPQNPTVEPASLHCTAALHTSVSAASIPFAPYAILAILFHTVPYCLTIQFHLYSAIRTVPTIQFHPVPYRFIQFHYYCFKHTIPTIRFQLPSPIQFRSSSSTTQPLLKPERFKVRHWKIDIFPFTSLSKLGLEGKLFWKATNSFFLFDFSIPVSVYSNCVFQLFQRCVFNAVSLREIFELLDLCCRWISAV